jgi:hypothetical protein
VKISGQRELLRSPRLSKVRKNVGSSRHSLSPWRKDTSNAKIPPPTRQHGCARGRAERDDQLQRIQRLAS